MDFITYITPITAFFGVLLSVLSIVYTKQQNTRRLDVNFKIEIFQSLKYLRFITIFS